MKADLTVCEGVGVYVVSTSANTARETIALLYGENRVSLERKPLRSKAILHLH